MTDDAFPTPPVQTAVKASAKIFLIALALGVLAGSGLGRLVSELLPSSFAKPQGMLMFFFVLVGMVPTLILHELGHALFGWLAGMKLISLGVGPLQIRRNQDQSLSYELVGGTRAFAGFALLEPPDQSGGKFAPWRFALFVLGGPLINLVQAALCLMFGVSLAHGAGGHINLAAASLGFGLAGLVIGLTNLIPFSPGGMQSDGEQLRDICRGGERTRLRMALLALVQSSMSGVAPWQLTREQIPDFIEKLDMPVRHFCSLYNYSAALYRGDAAHARAELKRLAELFATLPAGFRQGIAIQIACFLAMETPEHQLALAWQKAGEGGIVGEAERSLCAAAMAQLSGDHATTRNKISHARSKFNASLDRGWLHMTEWQLARLEARM